MGEWGLGVYATAPVKSGQSLLTVPSSVMIDGGATSDEASLAVALLKLKHAVETETAHAYTRQDNLVISKRYSRPCLPPLWPRLYAEPFGLGEKKQVAFYAASALSACTSRLFYKRIAKIEVFR